MGWSDINMDLLFGIMNKVDYVDAVRSEAVCRWWGSLRCRNYARKHQVPWLMLSSRDQDKIDSRCFYSITENKIICEISLQDIAGHLCMGSSGGYLLSVDPNSANIIATNPLAGGAHLPLPPASAFPDMVDAVRDPSGRITHYWITLHPEGSKIFTVERVCQIYYRKVILSSDAKIAVVIHGPEGQIVWLAFAHVGDQTWTALPNPVRSDFDDIIFHKERLHAINFFGTLTIFDIGRPSNPPFVSPQGPAGNGSGGSKRYLVESPCREKLFLLYRNSPHDDRKIRRTDYFDVYLLDEATYTWERIKSLGESSLFFGYNYSFSLDARQNPGIRKNCIYFTDDISVMGDYRMPLDMGIYSLEDTSVVPLYRDYDLDRFNLPPAMWYVHALS